jgi:glycosyltransferase involved in cell wall biosynthesis
MARLGIDASSVAPEGKGIDRVQRGTVRALASLGAHELVVFARHPEELPEVSAVAIRERLSLAWQQRGLPRAVREHRLDAVLTWTERLPVLGGGRYLVWLFEPPLHRISLNRKAGGAWHRGSDLVTRALWKRSLRRAALVLAGSRATAEAIREIAPARPLYPGLDSRFAPGPGREGRYVLHVASPDPRDDTGTAFAAAQAAAAPLVVAGRYDGAVPDGVELVGRVSDDELVALYQGAAAFLDTSLYEGFGYQVLEAMACGAPVVASATTSLPELVGDAGLLCPPGDVDAFTDALKRVLDDASLAARLRAQGLERARQFTWDRTARALAEAVDEVVA